MDLRYLDRLNLIACRSASYTWVDLDSLEFVADSLSGVLIFKE